MLPPAFCLHTGSFRKLSVTVRNDLVHLSTGSVPIFIAMAHLAEALKEQGNARFKEGKYTEAESLYTRAILRYSKNPLLFTNRANARLKLEQWDGVIDDCLRSIDLTRTNMKAFFYLGW